MNHRKFLILVPLALAANFVLLASSGCDEEKPRAAPVQLQDEVCAPPLPPDRDPIKVAAATALPERQPLELPGLHHVQRLSANIISGSEPDGQKAWASLRELGVRTILSVDGKRPDDAAASAAGMSYVHLPIFYKGIPAETAARIVKTFREMPKPFYVHCYHGLHRGPAAAALGRLVLDGATREQVLAEMLQWCGTSKGYPGLYESVARLPIPSAAETKALAAVDERDELDAFRADMILISRAEGALNLLSEHGFHPDPEHPDLDAAHEAATLADILAAGLSLDDTKGRPEEFRTWLAESASLSRELRGHLESFKNGDTSAASKAQESLKQVRATCTSCHKAYRDR